MLAAANRMRSRDDFRRTVRHGRRAAGRNLVAHLAFAEPEAGAPARVGMVVGRAVGPAHVRNQVKRRIRALMSDRIAVLPGDALVVVRASPMAARAPYAVLDVELAGLLRRVGVGDGQRAAP